LRIAVRPLRGPELPEAAALVGLQEWDGHCHVDAMLRSLRQRGSERE
jgi:hypothetical protein